MTELPSVFWSRSAFILFLVSHFATAVRLKFKHHGLGAQFRPWPSCLVQSCCFETRHDETPRSTRGVERHWEHGKRASPLLRVVSNKPQLLDIDGLVVLVILPSLLLQGGPCSPSLSASPHRWWARLTWISAMGPRRRLTDGEIDVHGNGPAGTRTALGRQVAERWKADTVSSHCHAIC
jgi:hypothetical protein